MDAIKAWAMTLCFAAVAAGMAGIIAPHGSMEKIYKFVISIFFLACLLVPVFSIRQIRLPEISTDDSAASFVGYGAESMVRQQQEQAVKGRLTQMITGCFAKYQVKPISTEIELSENQDGLGAGAITIVVSKGDYSKKDQLTGACKTQLGLDVQIVEREE